MSKFVFPAVLMIAIVGFAGCVDPMPVPPGTSTSMTNDETTELPVLLPTNVSWKGHLLVGAAYEAPAHFTPSENHVGSVWSAGFILDVTEMPTAMEVALDWTGLSGQLELMVHAPANHSSHDTWTEYATPMSDDRHQCLRIAEKDLKVGHWYLMAHSTYGAAIDLTITATLWEGSAAIVSGAHGHESTPDEVARGVRTIQKGPTGSEACQGP